MLKHTSGSNNNINKDRLRRRRGNVPHTRGSIADTREHLRDLPPRPKTRVRKPTEKQNKTDEGSHMLDGVTKAHNIPRHYKVIFTLVSLAEV